jgi:hypothetical protein
MGRVAENHDRGVDRRTKFRAARLIFRVRLAEAGLDEQRSAGDGKKQKCGTLSDFAKVHGFSIPTFVENWSKFVRSQYAVLAPGRKGLIILFSATSTFRPEPGRSGTSTLRKRLVFSHRAPTFPELEPAKFRADKKLIGAENARKRFSGFWRFEQVSPVCFPSVSA